MFSEEHQKGLFTFYWEQQELENQIKWKRQQSTLQIQNSDKSKAPKNIILYNQKKRLQQTKTLRHHTQEQVVNVPKFEKKQFGSSVVVVCRKDKNIGDYPKKEENNENENKQGKSNSAKFYLQNRRVAFDLKKVELQKIPIEQYRKLNRNELKLHNMNKYRQKKEEKKERIKKHDEQLKERNIVDIILPKLKKRPKVKGMKSENTLLRKEIQPFTERKRIEFNFEKLRTNSEDKCESVRGKLNLKQRKLIGLIERQRL